jgi:hypothetical protein
VPAPAPWGIPHVVFGRARPRPGFPDMTALLVVLVIALGAYLAWAMLAPERF